MSDQPIALRAKWIFPVDAPPIADCVIEWQGPRISSLRAASGRELDAVDLGNSAVIPGLVNTHTHLEFSGLNEPLAPPTPFGEWIKAVIADRRGRGGTQPEAVRRGLAESAAAGSATVGEIATPGWSPDCFGDATSRAVIFRELIALEESVAAEQLDVARRHVSVAPRTTADLSHGISPHAPYSVRPDLFEALVTLAAQHGAPLAFHLAETREELQLLRDGSGPLVDLFRASGFWREGVIPRGARPIDYLRPLAALGRALVIHGNYLDDAEIEFLCAHPNLALIYCPRTHAYFRHAPHPWRKVLERGGRVALGTDSSASNPDLSLWREVQYLRWVCPDVAPARLLELATYEGARALELDGRTGTLTAGKAADLAVVALGDAVLADPCATLLQPGSRVAATLRDGRWISGPWVRQSPAVR
jgi:cytosine/adenosine deaminase-related metal-dependent hydrolase